MRLSIVYSAFFFCSFLATSALAVLPPHEQKKWHEAYLQDVDFQGELSLYDIILDEKKGPGRRCQALYTFKRIDKQPQGFGAGRGNPLTLSYPCDEQGHWDWMGSTLPWAQTQADGRITAQIASRYLVSDGHRGWRLTNDPPVFAPVRPQPKPAQPVGEDVKTPADVKADDGIDRDEANVIAREFFHRYVSACGRLAEAQEKQGTFEYPVYFGKREKPGKDPVVIDRTNGQVTMKEFSTALDFKDIETEPPFAKILEDCEASGKEDILAWEFWLQRERQGGIYCPAIDYYTLILEKEDYPPEVRSLAAHQRYDYCKYGNPATIFAVYTNERSAKKQACAEPSLADVRAEKSFELQELPANELLSEPHRRFKIVSPHFAAVVYTSVYDLEKFDYWVDRSYEILRQAERGAVDCLYLKK